MPLRTACRGLAGKGRCPAGWSCSLKAPGPPEGARDARSGALRVPPGSALEVPATIWQVRAWNTGEATTAGTRCTEATCTRAPSPSSPGTQVCSGFSCQPLVSRSRGRSLSPGVRRRQGPVRPADRGLFAFPRGCADTHTRTRTRACPRFSWTTTYVSGAVALILASCGQSPVPGTVGPGCGLGGHMWAVGGVSRAWCGDPGSPGSSRGCLSTAEKRLHCRSTWGRGEGGEFGDWELRKPHKSIFRKCFSSPCRNIVM